VIRAFTFEVIHASLPSSSMVWVLLHAAARATTRMAASGSQRVSEKFVLMIVRPFFVVCGVPGNPALIGD
jgi:hypothetical protein